MASATSDIAPVTISSTSTNRRGRRVTANKQQYYKTQVTTLANGGVLRETYRTDAKGNNTVKISEATTSGSPPITVSKTLSTATAGEKKALQDKSSSLNNSINQQTKQAATKAKANTTDPVTDEIIDKASGGSGNTATQTPQTGGNQGGSTPSSSTTNTTKNFGTENMQYPRSIPDNQDVIQITALSYEAKQITGFSFAGRDRVTPGYKGPRSKGTVTLPIQSGIKDQTSAGWGDDTMNPVEAMAAKSALDFVMAGPEAAGNQLQKSADQIIKDTPQFQKGIGAAVVSSATGVKGILARTEGAVVNPNLELLFQKPTLRPFSFQFKLSARNKEETTSIIKIIRFFKQNMAPSQSEGAANANLFLKAPNTFQIHYLNRSSGSAEEHEYIGRIKECAMTSFEVDYTPDGNYATYADGSMVSYSISMSFKELEPVFSEDYKDIPDTSIGY